MGDQRRRNPGGGGKRPIRPAGAGRAGAGSAGAGRAAAGSAGAGSAGAGRRAEPDLLADVRRGLKSGEPIDLLVYVSSLMAALDPRRRNPLGGERASGPSLSVEELAATFSDVDVAETSALLAVIMQMSPDELVRARARRALARRDHRMPSWLTRLGETAVYRAAEMTHVLGDGDNIILGIRLGTGHELSAVVYVDHNLGSLVKDAFVVPQPIVGLIEFMRTKTDDPDLIWQDISLANARTKITHAIECGAMTFPPRHTQTWPACRPMLEWLTRSLPTGGTGYARPRWNERATKEVSGRFFASPFGARLKDADHHGLLESVLWFGIDYGPGDPMRWSPVNVEILLLDWIPRKIVADASYLSKVPELLRAFVAFCHDERRIRPDLTRQTLDAVSQYEADYQRIVRSPRPQGPAAMLAAMGMLGAADPWTELADSPAWSDEAFELDLAASVGGAAALESLDDVPLPDEDFDDSGVPDDIRPMVAEITTQCDKFCQDVGDRELRTACRRLLARAAAGDPAAFRRSARTDVAAAAVCWAVGKANDMFGPHGVGPHGVGPHGVGQHGVGPHGVGQHGVSQHGVGPHGRVQHGGGLLVKDLMTYFGLKQSSVSKRAEVLLAGTSWVGAPSLLTSSYRRHLIEVRDRYQQLRQFRATE